MAIRLKFACLSSLLALFTISCAAEETRKIIEQEIIEYKYGDQILDEAKYQELLKTLHPLAQSEIQKMSRASYQFDGKTLQQEELYTLLNSKPAAALELENRRQFSSASNAMLGLGLFFILKIPFEPKPGEGDGLGTAIDKALAPTVDLFWGSVAIVAALGFKNYGKNLSKAIGIFNGEVPPPSEPPEQSKPNSPFTPAISSPF